MAHWGAVAPKKKKQTNKIIFNYPFLKIFDEDAMAHWGLLRQNNKKIYICTLTWVGRI